jgi:hypothetical protein
MSEDKSKVDVVPFVESDAPFVFFDAAPVFGAPDGIVRITLSAARTVPGNDGVPRTEMVAVAYLRCHPNAAINLKNAIDGALLAGTKVEGQVN